MAKKLIAVDNGACELVILRAYPKLTASDDSIEITPSVNGDGETTYALKAKAVTEPVLEQAGASIKFTDGSGTVVSISVCDLVAALPDSNSLIGG
jgi:hypothetical protein